MTILSGSSRRAKLRKPTPATPPSSTALSLQWPERRKQFRQHRSAVLPAVEPILKLFRVAAKVLFRDADMRALDAAFQVPPKPFDAVHGRAGRGDILAKAVIDVECW